MRHDRTVEDVVATVDGCIETLLKYPRFALAATMFSAARIELVTRLHGVTEAELEQIAAIAALRPAPRLPKRRG